MPDGERGSADRDSALASGAGVDGDRHANGRAGACRVAELDTAIHAAWLAALHWHPVNVVSVNESVPPAAATDASAGAIENVHAAAAWLSES